MPFVSSPVDSVNLFVRDYRPAGLTKHTFLWLHGWPMSSRMFEHLALELAEKHGIRSILPDRRGFGNSVDWSGLERQEPVSYDVLAKDILAIVDTLHLHENLVVIGASMGCGEAVRMLSLDAKLQQNCKGLVFLGPSLPFPVQTADNPTAPPKELWSMICEQLKLNRGSFVKASVPNIFGAHIGVDIGADELRYFEQIIFQADAQAMQECIRIITETDFTDELEALRTPLLLVHGDSDNGMPVEASSQRVKKLLPSAQLIVYEKAAHGLYKTHAELLVKDVLEFVASL